jgi:hypothetical protein
MAAADKLQAASIARHKSAFPRHQTPELCLKHVPQEDELAAVRAVTGTTTVRGFTRTRPERNTVPDHLPRERVVIANGV